MENTFDLKKFLVENELTRNSKFLKEEQELSSEEQKIVDDILSGLDEGVFDDAIQKVKTYAKKGLLTAAMVTALLASPNLTQAQKTQIQNTATATTAVTTQKVNTSKSVTIPGSVKSISFAEDFASGKATLTNRDNLINNINELKDWMKGKKITSFKIVITAGESQVTNPKGFEKKGSLAQARAKAVQDVVSKLGFEKIDIQTKIGSTSYKPGDDINDPKYQAEQFVTVNIIVDNDICSMEPVSTNKGQGLEKDNYVTFNEYISGEGNLEMSTGTIPDRIVILDASGNIKQDSGYITTKIKDGDWQYTPEYVLALTKAYKAGNVSMKGIDSKLIIKVKDKYDLYNKLKKVTVSNPSLQGSEVASALAEMEGMINKGMNEFVIYNIGVNNIKLNFDDSKGDVQVKVYSPVGKTGYSVAGNCTR